MNVWDFLGNHGTKILGGVTAMVGAAQLGLSSLVSEHAITPTQGTIWQFILGVAAAGLGGATVIRGFSTGAVVQQARAIVAGQDQSPTPPTAAGAK
jgi:hypothetical protein